MRFENLTVEVRHQRKLSFGSRHLGGISGDANHFLDHFLTNTKHPPVAVGSRFLQKPHQPLPTASETCNGKQSKKCALKCERQKPGKAGQNALGMEDECFTVSSFYSASETHRLGKAYARTKSRTVRSAKAMIRPID